MIVWNSFKRHFFAGLVIIIPLGLTFYFIRFIFHVTSQTLLPVVTHQTWIDLPESSVRLISFLLVIGLVWLLGLLGSNWCGKWIVTVVERAIAHLPFFRGFYEAIQKMTEALFGAGSTFQSVVLVEYPRKGVYAFGFVTGRFPGDTFRAQEPFLCVFLPTVPNPTSGYVLYVAESETIPLSLTIEEAAKILVSHGFVPIRPDAAMPTQQGG